MSTPTPIPNTITLAQKPFTQIRLAIQSASGEGKTVAALTAPNPVVLDADNNLSITKAICAGKSADNVTVIPICDKEWIQKNLAVSNGRDAVFKWISVEAPKLSASHTLILDSWTFIQNAFDSQTRLEPSIGRGGAEDKFAFWERKLTWSKSVCEILRVLKCNVIVTFHETVERNEEGVATGKLKPLMQGAFADQLKGHFTDWFRQTAVAKLKDPNNRYSEVVGTDYMWQTQSDNICSCKTNLMGVKRLVPANWDVFVNPDKYK